MATVLFSAIGAALGGPVGAALGALAGSQVDSALFAGSGRQGPRLKDLTVTTSTYGAALPRHFGAMRVGGTIIWATDLTEQASTSSAGKGQPSVTTYSYASSFAVALASRPIQGIGRIWADGKLLRGAGGDLKVGGALRIYDGSGDQAVDPLIASAEGLAICPAFRGTAYVVFEGLQLAEFGNRIPSLNFEVFADEGPLSLSSLMDGVVDGVDAAVPLDGIVGFTCQEALADTLSQFSPVLPMLCDAGGEALTIRPERLQSTPVALGEAAVASASGEFGGKAGYSRKRSPASQNPPRILRYYDVALDYQAGSQRAPGKPLDGQPQSVDLPASLTSDSAFRLISLAARDNCWARETMSWRCPDLDPRVAPGVLVAPQGMAGVWRVTQWEWRETGVELELERVSPASAATLAGTSAGQAVLATDLAVLPTALVAYELPSGFGGSADTRSLCAAVSSAGAGWKGAALYVDAGLGNLEPIGTSGRQRATMGVAETALPNGPVGLFDRSATVTVKLLAEDFVLNSATPEQIAQGANVALIGQEVVQFGRAVALGAGRWRLEQLVRGCGGTEAARLSHQIGESFVVLDDAPVVLEAAKVPDGDGVQIGAIGVADAAAVLSPIVGRGLSRKPLGPVHPQAQRAANGDLALSWVRRARAAWVWSDGVDVPLQEEVEAYVVGLGPVDSPVTTWSTSTTAMTIVASDLAGLPSGALWVKQVGTYAASDPTWITQI